MRASFVVTVSALGILACQSPAPPDPTIPPSPNPPDPTPVDVQSTDPTLNTPDESGDSGAGAVGSEPPAAGADAGAATPDPNAPLKLSDFPHVLNDKTQDGRTIHRAWQGNGCFFYRDFPALKPGEQRPPGSEPPKQTVPCSPMMQDPMFDQCRGGTLQENPQNSMCVCFVMGNPPPPLKRVGCAKTRR